MTAYEQFASIAWSYPIIILLGAVVLLVVADAWSRR